MSKPSHIFALVEDQRQMQFLYRFLRCEGIQLHEVTIDLSPAGQGSAEQWVRENYAKQVGKCRARNAGRRAATSMFVLLDADRRPVKARLDELDDALEVDHQHRFDPASDSIARLIPKWSIETWILFLSSRGTIQPPLREDKSYKRPGPDEELNELIPDASKTLHAWTRTAGERPSNLIDSLRQGILEIPRALPPGR
jgi:hypothetical protein